MRKKMANVFRFIAYNCIFVPYAKSVQLYCNLYFRLTGYDAVKKFEEFYPTFERMSNTFTLMYDKLDGTAHSYEKNRAAWKNYNERLEKENN